jgi:DNA polymerase-3 subunit delta'
VARLSEGAVGRSCNFDLESYTAARSQALTILNSALRSADHSALFKVTETFRAGAEGREKTENLLRTLYSLLQDLMFLGSNTPELVRNTDIQGELKKLAESSDFAWIAFAADRLNEVERGMRRNLLRSLSLDAFATALEKSG